MKAIVCTAYGAPEVLQLQELAEPTPRPREVRIKVHAAAVTSSDCLVRSFGFHGPIAVPARLMLGITKPRHAVLGLVLAGEIETVGTSVRSFKAGDQVFAFEGYAFGAYAEYKCMVESGLLALKPSNLGYAEAAALPYGGMLALFFLRKGRIRSGQRVLIYGASGAVGTSAVQLAKHFGAEVTAVCSAANFDLVRSLGADAVIDYTKDDFTRNGERYDLILIAVGNRVGPPSQSDCEKALSPGGACVSVDKGRLKLRIEDLTQLKHLAEAGTLKAVIDRSYPLEEMVEAHRYVDQGHKKGNVVVTVA